MTVENIPPIVRQFLSDHITTVAQLEVLLLLRTDNVRWWSADALGHELRVERAWAQSQLVALCDSGLIQRHESDGSFRYKPATATLEQAVTALAQAYLLHRVSVIEMIYSRPSENLRAFSDAFKLRKEPPNA